MGGGGGRGHSQTWVLSTCVHLLLKLTLKHFSHLFICPVLSLAPEYGYPGLHILNFSRFWLPYWPSIKICRRLGRQRRMWKKGGGVCVWKTGGRGEIWSICGNPQWNQLQGEDWPPISQGQEKALVSHLKFLSFRCSLLHWKIQLNSYVHSNVWTTWPRMMHKFVNEMHIIIFEKGLYMMYTI